MPQGQQYAEQLGELRRHVADPVRGIILVEFTTIPQIEGIVAGLRALDPARTCLEVLYDPPRENAALYLDRARQELSVVAPDPLPLLILRPLQLPDAANDHATAVEFWRALNFRRETLGALPAQILLCVDAWHHDRLVDYAGDLRSWTAPKFHLLPGSTEGIEPSEGLAALSSFADLGISPQAARRRWETFWPELEKARAEHRLEPGHFRRYILPLLEAALAQGNLIQARQVRDAAQGVSIPEEDVIRWHQLNAMLACAAQDYRAAEDHARKLLEIARLHTDKSIRRKAFGALFAGTSLLTEFGQFAMAEELLRTQCLLSEELYGHEHLNTLASRNNFANALASQGKNAEAEREQRALLAIRNRVFGVEHRDTLSSRNNLAATLHAQDKHAEAEREQRSLLAIAEPVLGLEHPITLSSRNNLALVLQAQGKHAEAEREHRAELAICERVLGPEHPNTLTSRNNLAVALQAQGKHSEAEREHRAVLTIRERVLGPGHPDTIKSRNNVANALFSQGKFIDAEREHRTVLAMRERLMGTKQPDVFRSCYNLALCMEGRNTTSEALKFARRAWEGWKELFGEHHPDTQNAKALVDRLEREH